MYRFRVSKRIVTVFFLLFLSLFFNEVPDYTGENIAHILTQYELFTLDLTGEGEVVLDQRPKLGKKVA